MAEAFIQLPTDSTGKKIRTYDKGTPGHDQYVIPTTERKVDGTYMAAGFRQVATAATNINLCTIQNTTGATKLVAIRRLAVDVQQTAAYTAQSYVSYYHLTGVTPTGGTLATKHKMDSSFAASQANTEIRMGASADGTNTVPAHALPAGNSARRQAVPLLITAVGQWLTDDLEIIKFDQPPLILRANETGLIVLTGGSQVITNHYAVKIIFEEFTLP